MLQRLIVPIDQSPESWRAFDVARSLAARSQADVRLVHVASDPLDGRQAHAELQLALDRRRPFEIDVSVEVRLSIGTIASEMEAMLALHPGAAMVMASHGKGRSAALVGSVTEDLLHRTFGPIVLVGPKVKPDDFSGPIMVTVDGSQESEAALPLAAAWALELGTSPWIISVAEEAPAWRGDTDVSETAYTSRLAAGLRAYSDHPVEFDELHDKHPDRAVAAYASRHHASLIVAASHGRTGLSRLALGSTAAGFVRHATCPVVVVRLPAPESNDITERSRMWAY